MSNRLAYTMALVLLLLLAITIAKLLETRNNSIGDNPALSHDFIEMPNLTKTIRISDTVVIGDYFNYMDSLVSAYDTLTNYKFTEHLLVRANPWVIDTLANTDYYRMTQRDSFVYDQKKMIVFKPSDSLVLPDSLQAKAILESFMTTRIDINLPEYKLRIYQDSTLLFTFPIRIGQNKAKYLKMGNRITDLRTKIGSGKIIDHKKDPKFYNPVDGKQFHLTKRDDGKTTLMPKIPWIETEINAVRNGQLIHPTTNPITLEKAYSNGCIGVKEYDAWIIYYYSPIDTKINIYYNLETIGPEGGYLMLDDVYGLNIKKKNNRLN